MSNTDVAHSIAGYYYQILLAVREIAEILNNQSCCDDDWVAIEKGSDIKVSRKITEEVSIESKFYKNDKFTKEHKTIRHTIFNFYNDFAFRKNNNMNICRYVFATNVPVSSKLGSDTFFNTWNLKNIQQEDDYIKFVKECLVYESIQRVGLYRNRFENYKDKVKARTRTYPDDNNISEWYKFLLDDINKRLENYLTYADINENYIIEFIKMINFNFSSSTNIQNRKIDEINQNIQSELKRYNNKMDDGFYPLIQSYLIEKFYKTTVDRANLSASDIVITKGFVKEVFNKPTEIELNILNNEDNKRLIETIDHEIDNLQMKLRNYDSSSYNELHSSFVDICEKFVDKYHDSNKAFREFISDYVVDNSNGFIIIPNIASTIGTFITFMGLDVHDLILEDDDMNNITIGNSSYSIRATESKNLDTTELLLMRFIKKQVKSLKNPKGNEIIVFDAPSIILSETPCKYSKERICKIIDQTLTDYTQTYNNVKEQLLYKLLDYRCSKCLEPKSNLSDTEENVNKFVKNECKGEY